MFFPLSFSARGHARLILCSLTVPPKSQGSAGLARPRFAVAKAPEGKESASSGWTVDWPRAGATESAESYCEATFLELLPSRERLTSVHKTPHKQAQRQRTLPSHKTPAVPKEPVATPAALPLQLGRAQPQTPDKRPPAPQQQLPLTPAPSESRARQTVIDLCDSDDDEVDVKPAIGRSKSSAASPTPVAGPSRAQNAPAAEPGDPFAQFLDSLGESWGFTFSDYRDKFTSPSINISTAAQLLALPGIPPIPGQPSPLDTLMNGLEAAGMPSVWQAIFRHALTERAK